jgi:hypothetical protein
VKRLVPVVLGCALAAPAPAQGIPAFSVAPPGDPPAPWRVSTLPKVPRHTRFTIAERAGARALRVEADASYANLMFRPAEGLEAGTLRWRWRVDSLSRDTDLARKAGDDAPARLCVLFDLPLARLRLGDRLAMRLARAWFDPALPGATVCYVWDARPAAEAWLPNAYTDRVRMRVLQSGVATDWKHESRDLRADFVHAFPDEAAAGPVPRILAIGIGADGDNTGARSLAWIGDVTLTAD